MFATVQDTACNQACKRCTLCEQDGAEGVGTPTQETHAARPIGMSGNQMEVEL